MSVSHQTVTLARGKHRSPRNGACVMELASMLAAEPFTDRPTSVCPVVAAFLRAYNDAVDDARRQDLYGYASAAVGSRAGWAETRARAERCRAELRRLRRGPLAALTVPRTLPESLPALERLAGRLARDLHRSGANGHARALRVADELLEIPAGAEVPAAAPLSSRPGRARAAAGAR